MNTKLAIPFLAVLMAAQGCIVGGGGRDPGDVTFSWTFYGGLSCEQAGVTSVRIVIPGETLQNQGLYACRSNGYPGIVLHDFRGGTYTYSIEGLDQFGAVTYAGSGDFTIDGNMLETVDLTPFGQPGSYALVSWRFPGDVTCAQADAPTGQLGGVAYVDISLDGATPTRLNCSDGSTKAGSMGVYSPLVAPGPHALSLTALSASGYPMFKASHTLTTQAGNPVSDLVDLQWAIGGAVVSWTLSSTSSTTQNCGDTGVGNPTVYVQFVDTATNTALYPAGGDPNACNAAPTKYYYLPASGSGTNYAIAMSAANSSNATWSQVGNSPVVMVVPGVFPADTSPLNMVLRQN